MSHDAPPPLGTARTLADLARLAGVSAGTVSRALANSPLVNQETRARIQSLAAAHDFRVNQMARRLRTRKTGVIGVVVPLGHARRQQLSDPFFMTILGHLADALTENGYDVMLSRVLPDAEDWLERIVDSGMLDGVLLIGQSDQTEAIERVARRYRPLVAWGSRQPGQQHCTVGTENVAGGRIAAEHLIARSVRRIAFMGEVRAPELRDRYAGVCAAVADAGLPAPLQLDTHLTFERMEREVAAHLTRDLTRIDGIVAGSDVIAMTTLRVLADQGMAVPSDVPVVGYDDLPLALQTVPRLTTVRQDIARGAQAMVERLFARIAGEDAPSLVMPPELVVRDSA